MGTTEERMKILKMFQEGIISAEDASHLISALEERKPRSFVPPLPPVVSKNAHWFWVKGMDTTSGKTRINVRLSIGLIDAGMKMGARLSPEVQGLNADQLRQLLSSGEMGKVIHVFD